MWGQLMRTADIKQIKHLTITELFLLLYITNLNEIEHSDAAKNKLVS